MKVDRNSWHYKLRKKWMVRNNLLNIIERDDMSSTEYVLDVICAIISFSFLKSDKRDVVEFYTDKKS